MPICKIEWTAKKTADEKKEFMEFIADTVNKYTGTSKDLVYVYINDHEKENVRIDTPHIMINWTAFPERNPEAKEKIAIDLTEKITEITGADKSRTVVIFNDFPPTNGVVGGTPRSVRR